MVETPDAPKDASLRSALLALGYNQAVSLSFISAAEAQQFSTATPVALENPISEEAAVMRTSLVPSMVNMLAYNLNRGVNDVRLFEAGNVYELAGAKARGAQADRHRRHRPSHRRRRSPAWARVFVFRSKGRRRNACSPKFQHQSLYFDDNNAPRTTTRIATRGRCSMAAWWRGWGNCIPEVAGARKLRQDVYLAEIYLDRLYRQRLRQLRYQPISRYPAVDRDFSFLFDNAITFERIRAAVNALGIAELRSFWPVEIFRGGAVPAGQYSVLLRAEFQSVERTLRDDEVALWANRIINAEEAGRIQRA